MPIIDLEDVVGVIEGDGKVRCSECIDKIEDYWEKNFDVEKDEQITSEDLEEPKIYICDYCNKKL